jgi:hypothetical protein
MQEPNRDLLVLTKANLMSQSELARQIEQLHAMLFHTENWDAFSQANEIIDLNRHKILRKPFLIQKVLTEKRQKPFVFVFNKN